MSAPDPADDRGQAAGPPTERAGAGEPTARGGGGPPPPGGFGDGERPDERYEILRPLGSGGMGEVYLARDARLHRDVALKTPAPAADPAVAADFLREARAAATLRHPHLCPIYDVGERDGRPFLTMAHLPGGRLSDRPGPRPPRAAAALVRKLADAMAHAHDRGVVHRDLKPANVLLDEAGEPCVTDFGVALRLAPPGFGPVGPAGGGTGSYMSPEQRRGGAVGPRSDVYALGLILRELLTGAPPAAAPDPDRDGPPDPPSPPDPPPGLDPALAAILATMTARDPGARFATMHAVRDALDAYLNDRPGGGAPVPADTPPPARPRWGRWAAAAGLAAAAAAAVLYFPATADAPDETAVAVADETVTANATEPADDGWEDLFNGRDLAGWGGDRAAWAVEPDGGADDGPGGFVLTGRAPAGGRAAWFWLVSDRTFGDHEVRAVVRTSRQANAGVGVRHVPPGAAGAPAGGVEGPQADLGVGPDAGDADGGIFCVVPGEPALEVRPDAAVLAEARAARAGNGEPDGWDVLTVRAVGRTLAVAVNGVRTAAGRSPAIPAAGRVRLEIFAHDWATDPPAVRFRSLRARPLPP